MKVGEIYPTDKIPFLLRYHAIGAMDQGSNTRVLRRTPSPDSSKYPITSTRSSLENGLEIALVVIGQMNRALVRLGNEGLVYERTTPDRRTLFFAKTHSDKFDAVEN